MQLYLAEAVCKGAVRQPQGDSKPALRPFSVQSSGAEQAKVMKGIKRGKFPCLGPQRFNKQCLEQMQETGLHVP